MERQICDINKIGESVMDELNMTGIEAIILEERENALKYLREKVQ